MLLEIFTMANGVPEPGAISSFTLGMSMGSGRRPATIGFTVPAGAAHEVGIQASGPTGTLDEAAGLPGAPTLRLCDSQGNLVREIHVGAGGRGDRLNLAGGVYVLQLNGPADGTVPATIILIPAAP